LKLTTYGPPSRRDRLAPVEVLVLVLVLAMDLAAASDGLWH
jgi:hypothetical protein